MGVGILNSGLVPARFLCMISHLVTLITIFINRNEHVEICNVTETKTYKNFDDEFITGLSLSISFLVLELTPFVFGITLLNSFQSFISLILHSSASIALSFVIFSQTCSSVFIWPIFAICNCVPLFFEITILFGVWFLKKPIS